MEAARGRYTKHRKLVRPISEPEFLDRMKQSNLAERRRGFCAVLYYYGVRVTEALRSKAEEYWADEESRELYFNVGVRLKKGLKSQLKETDPLGIKLDRPFVDDIVWSVRHPVRDKPFPFCRKTGYNIVDRVFDAYPHYFRLSRITRLFQDGWTVPEVRMWTGLTVKALEHYIGRAKILEKQKAIR